MTKENCDSKKIETEVIAIIADRLGLPVESIAYDSYLFEDLNASKLEKADVIQTLAEKYQLTFEGSEIKSLNTVKSIIEFIIDNVN